MMVQVIEFTPTGELVRVLPDIPAGARICNVARAEQDDMSVNANSFFCAHRAFAVSFCG